MVFLLKMHVPKSLARKGGARWDGRLDQPKIRSSQIVLLPLTRRKNLKHVLDGTWKTVFGARQDQKDIVALQNCSSIDLQPLLRALNADDVQMIFLTQTAVCQRRTVQTATSAKAC